MVGTPGRVCVAYNRKRAKYSLRHRDAGQFHQRNGAAGRRVGGTCNLRPRCACMDDRASDYRRLARQCLEIAQTVSTDEARSTLIEMAWQWSRIADEYEP